MQNKQQEFLKQREKLKYVIPNNVGKKILDPDVMIEQLISDKETFKFNVETSSPYTLPKWLKVPNNLVPAVYEQVWQVVKLGPLYRYCDTKIITQLFTTSGLSLEKLGYLWSLTNVSSPGFLTQQELYVMLALIALVQTGYQVKDISIIRSINHPILPQLDYSLLNITVANPSVNRTAMKNVYDSKLTNSIVCNGVPSTILSNSVPYRVKPTDNLFDSKYLQKESVQSIQPHTLELTMNTQLSSEPRFGSLSTGHVNLEDMRKSEIDVAFVMPERKNGMGSDICTEKPVAELDVDFPISHLKSEVNSNLVIPEIKNADTNPDFFISLQEKPNVNQTYDESIFQKPNYNFLSVNEVSSNLEPRSLDLPIFSENISQDEEFTEFQSASVIPAEEYCDFQSASPVVKFKLDNLVNDNNFEPEFIPHVNSFKNESQQSDLMNDELPSYKTSIEDDKYDVFRALVQPKNEIKSKVLGEKEEYDDDEQDQEEEFSEFFTANVKPSQVKEEMPVKEKCLTACLRILQEGLRIFSGISKERVIKEVLCDERGFRYFNQLKIVYETSQRFQSQFKNIHLNDTLQLTWEKLSKYTKYVPSDELFDEVLGEEDTDSSPCKLCETKCDINCVRYAGNNYHVTCINLFLHFVEDSEITAMLNF